MITRAWNKRREGGEQWQQREIEMDVASVVMFDVSGQAFRKRRHGGAERRWREREKGRRERGGISGIFLTSADSMPARGC